MAQRCRPPCGYGPRIVALRSVAPQFQRPHPVTAPRPRVRQLLTRPGVMPSDQAVDLQQPTEQGEGKANRPGFDPDPLPSRQRPTLICSYANAESRGLRYWSVSPVRMAP